MNTWNIDLGYVDNWDTLSVRFEGANEDVDLPGKIFPGNPELFDYLKSHRTDTNIVVTCRIVNSYDNVIEHISLNVNAESVIRLVDGEIFNSVKLVNNMPVLGIVFNREPYTAVMTPTNLVLLNYA